MLLHLFHWNRQFCNYYFRIFYWNFLVDLFKSNRNFVFYWYFWSFFGPLFGIMISDYYFIRKGKLINKDIYSLEENGTYYFSAGWHLKGVYSLIIGFIFSSSTIWNSNFMFLQSYSWIIGAFISSFVYYLLVRE